MKAALDPQLLSLLACPRDAQPLTLSGTTLTCGGGHRYEVVDGIPVLLRDDVAQTHWAAGESLAAARGQQLGDAPDVVPPEGQIDPWVQRVIAATGGNLYSPLLGRLERYPIPALPLPAGSGRVLLDVGCNWGRWTLAAARAGYRAIGVDPYIVAVRAARRVATQLGIPAHFVVGDARYLPFRTGSLDTVFSYSVLQHFSKVDAERSAGEMGRVLVAGGAAKVQMPNAFGVRNLYHLARRRFAPGSHFEVRYWTPAELSRAFDTGVGPSRISVDGFFSLNPQESDLEMLRLRHRLVVRLSARLRDLTARHVRPLHRLADSLYVTATKARTGDMASGER